MKKRILNISLILLLGSTGSVLAQQGIGTNRPDKSAAVDIESTNKGLLIPRMALTWEGGKITAPTIASPAKGLLVYNNVSTENVPEGFYYYSNSLWNPIGVSEIENSTTTTISGNGTTATPYQVQVVTADTNTLGVVKPGTGLTIDSGTLNVIAADGTETKLNAGDFITITGNGSSSTPYLISSTDSQVLSYDTTTNVLSISGDTNTINLVGLKTILKEGLITSLSGSGSAGDPYIVDITKDKIQGNQIKYQVIDGINTKAILDTASTNDLQKYAVNVATADSNTLGVVQIGSGINVTNGVISVPPTPGETTTFLNFDSSTTNLTYLSEDTSTSTFTLNLGDVIRVNQNNSSVTGSAPVKIDSTTSGRNTTYNVSVDTATATTLGVVKPGTGITITADGTLNVLPQADTVTTLTGVKPTGNAIGTYKNEAGTDVVINETITSIKFDSTTSVLTYTPETGETGTIELNLSSINSDKQQLSLDTNTLKLERSGSVDLSKYLDNTDNQSLSFDTSSHILKITGDSNTIDFSNYKNKVYTLASDMNTISLLADGASIDSETVVKNVDLNLSADKKLTAKVNGVASATTIDLSVLNTDNQYLTFDSSTNTLAISGDTRTVNVVTKLNSGNNTTVSGNGTTATPYKVDVATANSSTLGVVKPGSGLDITTDGTLNVNFVDTNSKSVVNAVNTNVVVTPSLDTTTNTTTYAVDVKNAMPKFFYMPSILINTSQITATGSPDLEVNLYAQYTGQFNVTNAAMRSAGAPAQIPVLPAATDLYYYVTYSDTASIQITGISNDGKMKYRVLGNTNSLSFVNIVFVIK